MYRAHSARHAVDHFPPPPPTGSLARTEFRATPRLSKRSVDPDWSTSRRTLPAHFTPNCKPTIIMPCDHSKYRPTRNRSTSKDNR